MTKSFAHNRLVAFYVVLLLFQTASPYSFNGNVIRDLETTGDDFKAEASANWHASVKASTDVWSDCNGLLLVGGYGVLGGAPGAYTTNQYLYRDYSGLPAHTMIKYSFYISYLDSWDLGHNDGYRYTFDGKAYDGWKVGHAAFDGNTCGLPNYKDALNVQVYGTAVHSGSTLQFRIYSQLNEDPTNESFGIRDITLTFYQGPITQETQCSKAAFTLPERECKCAKGKYHDGTSCVDCHENCDSCYGPGTDKCYACKQGGGVGWDGFDCVTCHTYCSVCTGTANNQCTECKSGYSYYAPATTCLYDCPFPLTRTASGSTYTCASPCAANEYIYWDKSCETTCAAPLVSKTLWSDIKLCTYPCTPGEYLYWDGTCLSDCELPLKITTTKGKKYCTYKCTGTQFLDWTDTCVASCASPFVQRTIKGKKICASPCEKPGDFLYWDNECASTCGSPLDQRTASNNIKYCDFGCATATHYLYWDETCSATCDSPLKVRIERGKKFCDFPADASNYLYWDGTESATCPSPPLTQSNIGATGFVRKLCKYDCDVWEYLYWDGSCSNECLFPLTIRKEHGRLFCDYPCTGTNIPTWDGSCVAPSACTMPLQTRTVAGGKQVCDFPAGDTSKFVYWDQTFSEDCPVPLIQRIEGTTIVRKFCDFGCVDSTKVLFFDGTCGTTCTSPILLRNEKGRKFCDFKCGTEYEYYNTTCSSTCDTPFVRRTAGAGKYCDHPCSDPTNFYYWNSDCKATCPSPLQQYSYKGIKWCLYPCSANQFLTKDGVCLDSCDDPFQTVVDTGLKYCENPCLASDKYLFWDGTCISSCEPPLRSQSSLAGKLCYLPCETPEEYYSELTGGCVTQCHTTTVSVDGLYYKCLASKTDNSTFLEILLDAPSNSVVSLVSIPNLLEYVRYVDLGSPPRFQKLVVGKGYSPITLRFGPKMSDEMRAEFPNMTIPAVFERAGLHSSFFVNFYEEITSWAIVIVTIVIFIALEVACSKKDWDAGRIFFEKLVTILKWNYIFVMISTSILKVIVFVSLQFKTTDTDSSFAGLSIELCLIMVSFCLLTMIGSYWLVLQHQAVRKEGPIYKISEFLAAWKGYQILFRGFKDGSWTTEHFYLFYLIRLVLVGILASEFYFTPVFQTASYMVLSILMVSYLLKTRPIVRRINLVQLIVFEMLVLLVNISLFALAILHKTGKQDTSLAVMFGDFAIAGVSATNILFMALLPVKVLYGAVAIYKGSSALKKRSLSNWVPLLTYYVQQGGMGFEDISLKNELEIRNELGATNPDVATANKRLNKVRLSRIAPEEDNSKLLVNKAQAPTLELNMSYASRNSLSPVKFRRDSSNSNSNSNNDSAGSPIVRHDGPRKKSIFAFSTFEG